MTNKHVSKWTMILTIVLTAAVSQGAYTGQVVDQSGTPVAGATVYAVINDHGLKTGKANPILTTNTNESGQYTFETEAETLEITTVKKQGYILGKNQLKKINKQIHKDSNKSAKKNKKMRSDSSNMIIKIHKKAGPTFLHQTQSQFSIKATDTQSTYIDMGTGKDISKRFKKSFKEGKKTNAKNSLQIDGLLDAGTSQYQLTFTCQEKGTGVIITDELLYEAPADGYQAVATADVPYSNQKPAKTKLYAYLRASKGKDQSIYSRMDLDIIAGSAELIANTTTWTNPKGERNLEYDEKFQRQYIAQRQQELQTAIGDKTATEEQIEEYHQLMQMQHQQYNHNRWNFKANQRQATKKQLQQERAAQGRTRPKRQNADKKTL